MTQIVVVSRISEDKNAFFDVIYALQQLTEQGITDIKVLFVGDIFSDALYRSMIKLTNLFGLEGRVNFTKKSIRFKDLPDHIKEGYFVNFTIGNFIGFSGIESINMGFKSIFYNAVNNLASETIPSISQAVDLTSFVNLLRIISTEPRQMAELIMKDNLEIKRRFRLSKEENEFLISVLLPSSL